jgi:small subunit ribosomal protein S6
MALAQAAAAGRAREYETIYVLRPDVARESADRVAGRMQEVVGRENGTLTLVENWGRRELAYRVGRWRRGVYVYLKYVGGGSLVSEIERNLRMLDDVIKYQTVKVRDEIDAAALEIDPEVVKFEPLELPDEPEETEEELLARTLGLRDMPGDGMGMDPRDRRMAPPAPVEADDDTEDAAPGAGAAESEEDES